MTNEEKLNAFFAADAAPAYDPAFAASVAEAVARRRLRLTIGLLAALAVALGAVAWAVAPAAGEIGNLLTTPGLPVAALIAALGAFGPALYRRITSLVPTRS